MSKEPEAQPDPEALPELEELEAHDPQAEQAPEPESAASVEEEPAAPVPALPPLGREPARPTKRPGEKRELEQAPLHLRKASIIVGVGALFPFFTALNPDTGISWGALMGAKVLALIAGWLFHQGYMASHGGQAVPAIQKLAQGHELVPPILAGLVAIGALVAAYACAAPGGAIGEVATLILASGTFSHIWAYENGGKFNPIFPLMFLGPAISGLANVIKAASQFGVEAHAGIPILGLVGGLVVGAGGLMAIYTMYEAMKQAKIDGDIKKEQLREYRKSQREAQRATRAKGDQG